MLVMGKRGRFGKYGETKRLDRLRQARKEVSFRSAPRIKSLKAETALREKVDRKSRVRIRPATASDLDFVIRLSGKVFHIYGPYRDMISQWFESEITETIVAQEKKKPVGFAMLGPLSKSCHGHHGAEILAIAVEPAKQNMGTGQKLIEAIEAKAAELNVTTIFLHTCTENLPARKLFVRNSYQALGIESAFYPAGQDALAMSKDIKF